jgi:hypothetical protein
VLEGYVGEVKVHAFHEEVGGNEYLLFGVFEYGAVVTDAILG